MDSVTVEGAEDLGSKPAVTVDTSAEPPGVLVSDDLVTGDGPESHAGAIP